MLYSLFPYNVFGKDTCKFADENGHLEVLNWARTNECPWHQETCELTAGSSHLEVLKWALDASEENRDPEIMEYVQMEGRPPLES